MTKAASKKPLSKQVKILIAVVALALLLAITGAFVYKSSQQPMAIVKTNMGEIHIQLYPEEAPLAVENFITHSKNGYYDGIIFHRVVNGFMIQGGDPTGTGFSGESIYTDKDGNSVPFEDEFSEQLLNFRGALSMANSGPNTNGSQFFIVQANTTPYSREMFQQAGYPEEHIDRYLKEGGAAHLDGQHTVFGMVVKGMDVVDAIAAVQTDLDDRPLNPVVIESITIKYD